MFIKYSYSLLSNGKKVKITKELKYKIAEWEKEGYEIDDTYIDFLKKSDDIELNSERNYYTHNVSMESQIKNKNHNTFIEDKKTIGVEEVILKKEEYSIIISKINNCTEKQKYRVIKYYYQNYTLQEISEQEKCSPEAIFYSIKAALKNMNIL